MYIYYSRLNLKDDCFVLLFVFLKSPMHPPCELKTPLVHVCCFQLNITNIIYFFADLFRSAEHL